MRVALFARVSTDEQAEAGRVSLPAQLRVMRERIAREGWSEVALFEAAGESAYTDDLARRPRLLEAVEAAERGEFDILMVHESSRFARNAFLALALRRRLERAGVRLIEANEALVDRNAERGLFFTMQSGINEYWSEKISEHTKKVKRQLWMEGLHLGDPPFGYRRTESRRPFEVVPEEAAAVVEGFRDYVAGATYTEILQRWNASGLRPRSKQGHTRFTVPAMQAIFENRFYAGFVSHKGEWRPGAHEALISEEMWQAAQSRVRTRPSRVRRLRMLSGVAMCSECGGPMWLRGKGERKANEKRGKTAAIWYYREASLERGRECPNAGVMWRADQVEEHVHRAVRAMTMDSAWLRRVSLDARRTPSADHSVEREQLQAEKRRTTNAYLAGALEESEWRSRVAGIDARLGALGGGGATVEGVVFAGEKLESMGQLWDVFSDEARREACRLLFSGVLVDAKAREVWVKPWEEFAPYFEARRELVGRLVGPPGFEPRTNRL